MRKLASEDTERIVIRDGVSYMFTRLIEPAVGDCPRRAELIASKWTGFHWMLLHRIVIDSSERV